MPAGSTGTGEAIDRIVDRVADPVASEEQRRESFYEAARLLPFDEQGEGRALYGDELMASRIAVASPRTIDTAEKLLEPSESAEVRWIAFVIGSIAARRLRQMTKAQDFRELGERDFGDRRITLHFRGLSYLNEATEGLRKGYKLERQALEAFPRHVGILHATAYFIVELAECGVPEIRKAELQEGVRLVEGALSQPRARFYYTRGRLYRHLGEFDAARQDIRRAIDLEDRSAKDYLERFVDYSIQLSSISVAQDAQAARENLEREIAAQLHAAEEQVDKQTRRAIDRVDRAEIRLVEVVAFIIAAVGLVQFTLGAVTKRSFLGALGLEIAFGIIMFGAVYFLSWLLRRPREA